MLWWAATAHILGWISSRDENLLYEKMQGKDVLQLPEADSQLVKSEVVVMNFRLLDYFLLRGLLYRTQTMNLACSGGYWILILISD